MSRWYRYVNELALGRGKSFRSTPNVVLRFATVLYIIRSEKMWHYVTWQEEWSPRGTYPLRLCGEKDYYNEENNRASSKSFVMKRDKSLVAWKRKENCFFLG